MFYISHCHSFVSTAFRRTGGLGGPIRTCRLGRKGTTLTGRYLCCCRALFVANSTLSRIYSVMKKNIKRLLRIYCSRCRLRDRTPRGKGLEESVIYCPIFAIITIGLAEGWRGTWRHSSCAWSFAPTAGGAAGLGALHTNNTRLAPVRRQALGSKRGDGVSRLEGTTFCKEGFTWAQWVVWQQRTAKALL